MLQNDIDQFQYPPKPSPKFFCDKISFDDVIEDENSNPFSLDHKIPLTKRIAKNKNIFFNLELKKIIKQDKNETNAEKLSNELKKLMKSCGLRFNLNYTCRDFNQQKTKNKKLTPFQLILKENEALKEIIKLKKIKNSSPSNLRYIVRSGEIESCGNIENRKNKFNLNDFIYKKKSESKKSISRKKNNNPGHIYKNYNNIRQKIFNNNKIDKISLLNILNENNNNLLKNGMINKIQNTSTKNNNFYNYMSDRGNFNNGNINNKSKSFRMKTSFNNYKNYFINKPDYINNNHYFNRNCNAIFSIEKKEYNKTCRNGISFDRNFMRGVNKRIKNGFSSEKCQTINFEDINYNKSLKNLCFIKPKRSFFI